MISENQTVQTRRASESDAGQGTEAAASPSGCGNGQATTGEGQPQSDAPCCSLAAGAEARDEQRYRDLLSFIISNAVAGEIMAVENYSQMVPLVPDTEEKIVVATQSHDECKHIRLLTKLGERAGFSVKQTIVEPQWLDIRRAFGEAVGNNDLTSCYLIQDLMTETLAIVLYRTLTRDTDALTGFTAANILRDELHHLDIGVERVKRMLDADPERVHQSLVWSHNKVMPQLFSMISSSCHYLCDELQIDCGSLRLDSINTDLEKVRADATAAYVETLERCEFAPKITMPLIANLA
jgi:fatty aldehyde decarbonylase